jgi:hypothetical protein
VTGLLLGRMLGSVLARMLARMDHFVTADAALYPCACWALVWQTSGAQALLRHQGPDYTPAAPSCIATAIGPPYLAARDARICQWLILQAKLHIRPRLGPMMAPPIGLLFVLLLVMLVWT